MSSPFLYDNIALKDNFFGRKEEFKKLDEILKHHNNLLIYSKRRMGKTTLVKNFLSLQKDTLTLYIDIFDITSKEDFASALLKSLSNSYNHFDIKKSIKLLSSLFKRVRVEPSIDPSTLEYSIKPILVGLTFEEMFEEFFNSIKQIAQKQKVVIAIDEFQEIENIKDIKLDAMLRKYIQERENTSYIFLGSKRHILTSLFSYKAPLFELAEHFNLEPLKLEDIYNYSQKFIKISKEDIEYIYTISDGETKILLHILHLLYIKKEKISSNLIDIVLQEIVASKDTAFRMVFDTLNNNKKLAIKLIVKYKSNLFSNQTLLHYNIKKQTLQSAINSLYKKEFIDKEGTNYFIPDRSFEIWVEKILDI